MSNWYSGTFDWPVLILAACGVVVSLSLLTAVIPPLGIAVIVMLAIMPAIFMVAFSFAYSVYGIGWVIRWLCRRLWSVGRRQAVA